MEFVHVLYEDNQEVGDLGLADGVVVRQAAALTRTVALGRLVVPDVLEKLREETLVEHSRIADGCVTWPHSSSRMYYSSP